MIALLGIVTALLLPQLRVLGVPGRDSGVFLYVAQQILTGAAPYREVWDLKPPAIHLINALGLLLGSGSPLGVWILEVLFLYVAALLSLSLLKMIAGWQAAIIGTGMWLLSFLHVVESGNLTEQYALVPQFGILYLFHRWWEGRQSVLPGIGIGVLAALCFCLRQNLTGIALVAVFLMCIEFLRSEQRRKFLRFVGLLCLGAWAVLGPVGVYVAANLSLADFWDATVRFNVAYVRVPAVQRRIALISGVTHLSQSGLSLAALAAWAIMLLTPKRTLPPSSRSLLWLALIDLPVEMILSSLSGNSYPHYYMAWLPSSAVLVAFLVGTGVFGTGKAVGGRRIEDLKQDWLWVVSILLVAALIPVQTWYGKVATLGTSLEHQRDVVTYVMTEIEPDDCVLMWGAETSINFVTGRRAPSRFAYQYPLYRVGYQTVDMIREFLDDLKAQQPALIIDSSRTNCMIPPLDPSQREKWQSCGLGFAPLPEMEEVYAYVLANYELAARLFDKKWDVFRYAREYR